MKTPLTYMVLLVLILGLFGCNKEEIDGLKLDLEDQSKEIQQQAAQAEVERQALDEQLSVAAQNLSTEQNKVQRLQQEINRLEQEAAQHQTTLSKPFADWDVDDSLALKSGAKEQVRAVKYQGLHIEVSNEQGARKIHLGEVQSITFRHASH